MTINEKSKNRKYEFVAPDGGWGYAVGVGFIINTIVLTSFLNCFGMIFKDIFVMLNMDSTTITLLNGVGACCASLTAFITSPLLNYLSIRQLGMIAALVYNLGAIGTVFVNSRLTFFICYGALQSLGNGILMNLAFTALNDYFVKKRLLACSFTQTIIAVSALVVPQFLKWSLKTYGIRGTLLLIAGISFHNIFGTLLMQPVAWHMKKVEVPENKEDGLVNSSNQIFQIWKSIIIHINIFNIAIIILGLVIPEMKLLLTKEKKIEKMENPSQETKDADTTIVGEKCNVEDGAYKNISPNKKKLSDLVDFKLYRSLLLSNASIGMGICVFSEFTFILMLPQALYSMGWDEGLVAWALSLNAMGDLATRFLFTFTSSWLLNFGSSEIYVTGLVIAFITRIGMLWSENIISMMTFITLMGVSRCSIMILNPVVVADAVKAEHFTSAMGLQIAIVGIFNVTLGPVIGAVRDLTDSYATAFYIMASCFGIVIIFWSIELLYKKNKHKRQPKEIKE